MGQQQNSSCSTPGGGGESLLTETVEALSYEIRKHANILGELGTLSYEDFLGCLDELNKLSRGCLDGQGMRMLFVVRKGSDDSPLWKVTVRIGCIRVDPISHRIDRYQLLNLNQFLKVYKTFQSHVEVLTSSEQQMQHQQLTTSVFMDQVEHIVSSSVDKPVTSDGLASSSSDTSEHLECIICMDRKPDVSLPCAHYYCFPCIEQWRDAHNTCPVCQEVLPDTDDSWELTEKPATNEVNDKICAELMGLSVASIADKD